MGDCAVGQREYGTVTRSGDYGRAAGSEAATLSGADTAPMFSSLPVISARNLNLPG